MSDLTTRAWAQLSRAVWLLSSRWEPLDERGGGRNTDEGFHISAGAVIAGVIATAVGAFIAKKLGALE
ncbi:hypothetical protein [Pseudonocardia abyssalis]|uniref:Uncharacterized protein n=1 Tax=Pseudonocardia abyssalis TaxID=2792008 RepID=A0ABS6URR3_9PSEU|nr:hypothetical protein [Pseudonocardia abyssalis]MBW0113814.1 hypothetical protein [Pseudonocardia abyssalis]MBW0134944.1 hypothetical protein [Pseudonocardia abyssalis]